MGRLAESLGIAEGPVEGEDITLNSFSHIRDFSLKETPVAVCLYMSF